MKNSKKSKSSSHKPSFFKKLTPFAVVGIIGFGAYALWEANPDLRQAIGQYVDNGEITTLEVRYTPEKIIETYGKGLLGDTERTFQKAELKFYPYTLFEVKYSSPEKKTKEGFLLWGLVDGEIVTDCEQWNKTHGFQDAINAAANRNDFKLLHALEKNKGQMTIDQLQKELQVEQDILLSWIKEAKSKHLIVQKGNELQLHFQDPRLLVTPQTKMSQCFVTKPYNYAQKVPRRYSTNQIEKSAQAAFGQDFTIRSQETVYLPVYSLDIRNADGSVRTVDFNAVTGTPMKPLT